MSSPIAVPVKRLTFKSRARHALHDDFLRRAVRLTVERLRTAKANSTERLGRWEQWRDQGKAVREHVIDNLDVYLAEFARNVESRGQRVFFAADAEEASAEVLRIVTQKSARLAVKSKSMVSEEIHLNARLAAAGVECVETDLGEWIVQLANEAPSHIIIPAIHKSRHDVQALFESHGDAKLGSETPVLAGYARRALREYFARAGVGITGCNFALASTGSIVLFTNEGNGRMVTTLPETHIVVMGMERILPGWEDLELMAKLLPRSATGQELTTYVNIVTGVRDAHELDGAGDLHVIVLDNGRSRQLADPHFREVLNCIRCGACLNVCPVYRQVGGHAYGSEYPGPIGAVLSPLLDGGEKRAELADASSLCGACFEACPVKIPLHDLLLRQRERNAARGAPFGERLAFRAFARLMSNPRLYRRVTSALRAVQRLVPMSVRRWLLARLPGPARAWASTRELPLPAARSFHELVETRAIAVVHPGRERSERLR